MKQLMFSVVFGCALTGSTVFAGSDYPVVLGGSVSSLKLGQMEELNSELIGGGIVTTDLFPGVFYTRQGNSRCTGTLIGNRVVASAAHCMSNGAALELTHAGKVYKGKCAHAPEYKGNATADWALCLLSDEVPDSISESINISTERLKLGGEVVLMGYGCIQNGGGGGNDGKLRVGKAPITRLPTSSNHDIVTKGKSALCFGDSGGPSFYVDKETRARFQIGINSRGDIATTSYLSSLHNPTALKFYRSWSALNKVKICGLHDDAVGCRPTN